MRQLLLLQSETIFITQRGNLFFKVRQILLKSTTGIAKHYNYYKMRHNNGQTNLVNSHTQIQHNQIGNSKI